MKKNYADNNKTIMIAAENKCILKVKVKKIGLNYQFIIYVNVINNILFVFVSLLRKNDNAIPYFSAA